MTPVADLKLGRSVVRAWISSPAAIEMNRSTAVPTSATSVKVPEMPPESRSETRSGRMLHRTGVAGASAPVDAAILTPSAAIHPSESTTARWRLAMPSRRANLRRRRMGEEIPRGS